MRSAKSVSRPSSRPQFGLSNIGDCGVAFGLMLLDVTL
jgi:hypothetical protein